MLKITANKRNRGTLRHNRILILATFSKREMIKASGVIDRFCGVLLVSVTVDLVGWRILAVEHYNVLNSATIITEPPHQFDATKVQARALLISLARKSSAGTIKTVKIKLPVLSLRDVHRIF